MRQADKRSLWQVTNRGQICMTSSVRTTAGNRAKGFPENSFECLALSKRTEESDSVENLVSACDVRRSLGTSPTRLTMNFSSNLRMAEAVSWHKKACP